MRLRRATEGGVCVLRCCCWRTYNLFGVRPCSCSLLSSHVVSVHGCPNVLGVEFFMFASCATSQKRHCLQRVAGTRKHRCKRGPRRGRLYSSDYAVFHAHAAHAKRATGEEQSASRADDPAWDNRTVDGNAGRCYHVLTVLSRSGARIQRPRSFCGGANNPLGELVRGTP